MLLSSLKPDSWSVFGDNAVSAGHLVALAIVCLLQYAYALHKSHRAQLLAEQYRREMQGLSNELRAAQKDGSLARLENQILREFVTQTNVDRALGLLLKRFVPNTNDGFGAIVRFQNGTVRLGQSRGLSEQSCRSFKIDVDVVAELRRSQVVTLEDKPLHETQLLNSLSSVDRGKVCALHLIGIGEPDELVGALVTTSLCPADAPREQQVELARRLMQSVASNLRRSLALELREHQLQSTNEMLELRSIADRGFDSPLTMVEEFLNCLIGKLGAERAVLFLTTPEVVPAKKALVRCGGRLQPGLLARWHEHEDRLARATYGVGETTSLAEQELNGIGIETLIRQAIVSPVTSRHGGLGLICLTKSDGGPFPDSKLPLVDWASGFLSETIYRVLNQAAVERQARLDGLTELANRREFDRSIQAELQRCRRTGAECSLLLLDLDRFKTVNDNYGHPAGDEVLRVVARVLRDQNLRLRADDRGIIARYGGEEMAMLLPGVSLPGAQRVGELIREAVAGTQIDYQQHRIRVTLSAGIASFPQHAGEVDKLIAAADAALYRAKQTGRNCVCTAAEDRTLVPAGSEYEGGALCDAVEV